MIFNFMNKEKIKKSDAKYCWDYFNCSEESKEYCLVYKNNLGDECWCACNLGVSSKKRGGPEDCEWYKLNRKK